MGGAAGAEWAAAALEATVTPGYALPGGLAPGLEARVNFDPGALTHCNGTHACEVEVEPLEEYPAPAAGEIREAISGNLCRCTGYQGIVRATLAAAGDLRSTEDAQGN